MSITRFDVAVVGAGPAGTSAAWCLARSGARVALLDASHPREKPCGGGLTGRALAGLRPMLRLEELPRVLVQTMRFESGQVGTAARTSFGLIPEGHQGRSPDTPPLAVVSRLVLDLAMVGAATAAGARMIPERVRDIEIVDSGARMTTMAGEYGAEIVLGADGATSLVRRRLAVPFTRSQISVATGYFVPGASSSEVVIHCFGDPPGYLWSFPRSDHLAVGICAPGDRVVGVESLRAATRQWIEHADLPPRATLEPYSWPIPSLGRRDFGRPAATGPRWMLLGDAAGLVDPLTREGLYYAIRSGQLAAEAIAIARDPFAAYDERLADEVYPELERAAALGPGFFFPRFSDLLVSALDRSEAVRSVMVDLVAGRQPYRSLRRRLLGTLEAGLAWRLLRLHLAGLVSGG